MRHLPARGALEELRTIRDVLVRVRDGAKLSLPPEHVAEWVALIPHLEEMLALAGQSGRGLDDLAPERVAEIQSLTNKIFCALGMPLMGDDALREIGDGAEASAEGSS